MLFIHLWRAQSDETTWSEFHRHNSRIFLVCPINDRFLNHMSAITLGYKKLVILFPASNFCTRE